MNRAKANWISGHTVQTFGEVVGALQKLICGMGCMRVSVLVFVIWLVSISKYQQWNMSVSLCVYMSVFVYQMESKDSICRFWYNNRIKIDKIVIEYTFWLGNSNINSDSATKQMTISFYQTNDGNPWWAGMVCFQRKINNWKCETNANEHKLKSGSQLL